MRRLANRRRLFLGGVLALVPVLILAVVAWPRTDAPDPSTGDRFWAQTFGGGAVGPIYRSLEEVGARSEAVVVGTFTGVVEPGREVRDLEAEADGASRAEASVFHANAVFQIDEVVAGRLKQSDGKTIRIEFLVGGPDEVPELVATLPSSERVALFVGSGYLSERGWPGLHYVVGLGVGVFREVDGRVRSLRLRVDPNVGTLDGMPFQEFLDKVRSVPILDLPLEG